MQNELERAQVALEEQEGLVQKIERALSGLQEEQEAVKEAIEDSVYDAIFAWSGTATESVEDAVVRKGAIEVLRPPLRARLKRENRELEKRQGRVGRIKKQLAKIAEDLDAVDGAPWPADLVALHRARLVAERHALAGDDSEDPGIVKVAKEAMASYDGSLTVTARTDLAKLKDLVEGLEGRANE